MASSLDEIAHRIQLSLYFLQAKITPSLWRSSHSRINESVYDSFISSGRGGHMQGNSYSMPVLRKLVSRPGLRSPKIHRALFALTFVAFFAPAEAHDWYSGIRNPATGVGCCGGNDCTPIDIARVIETRDEFIVDGKWHFLKSEAMPAQDGQYHACIWGGKPRCFFYPMNV